MSETSQKFPEPFKIRNLQYEDVKNTLLSPGLKNEAMDPRCSSCTAASLSPSVIKENERRQGGSFN